MLLWAVRELVPGVDVRESPDYPVLWATAGDRSVVFALTERELADTSLAPWVARKIAEWAAGGGQAA